MLGWESTVAGLHRLLDHRQALAKARAIINRNLGT